MASQPESFRALLLEVLRQDASWSADDLGDILRHLLDGPLSNCIRIEEQDLQHYSLRQVLCEPKSSVAILSRIKDFAKSCRADPVRALPDAVTAAVYFSAISAGITRHGEVISSLDAHSLREGLNWMLGQEWLDPGLRPVLDGGLLQLGSAG